MTVGRRIRAEAVAEWRSFVRQRTAVFFTFLFPIILIVIFGALVRTDPTDGGLFAEPAGYYLPGYLAVVVLFTPLSRVSSTVARHREGNRFEKLATTPLTRWEWLAAHTVINAIVVTVACLLVVVLIALLTDAYLSAGPVVLAHIVVGVVLFCGMGALLGRLADSRDGAIAAANTIALPMLFLSETFIPQSLLPGWLIPLLQLLPLTYFSRGVRAASFSNEPWVGSFLILSVLAATFFLAGAYAIPRTE